MAIEIEKKYLFDSTDTLRKLKDTTSSKKGIIQWYLSDRTGEQSDGLEKRLRLEITPEGNSYRHTWTYAEKRDIPGSAVRREEREETLDVSQPGKLPHNLNLDNLMDYPFVAKIRYHLESEEKPLASGFPWLSECVLDEFLSIGECKISQPDIMEIELHESENPKPELFEKVLQALKISGKCHEAPIDPSTGKYEARFKNEAIARKWFTEGEKPSLYEAIEFLENWLKGEVRVVSLLGLPFSKLTCTINHDEGEGSKNQKALLPESQWNEKIVVNKKETPLEKGDLLDPQRVSHVNYTPVFGLCPELDTLYLMKQKGFRVKEIHYFVFPDEQNRFHFQEKQTPLVFHILEHALHRFFGDVDVFSYPIHYYANRKESINPTFSTIWEKLEILERDASSPLVIDVTSGQKYPGIMLSLYCMFHQKPFFYKQNECEELIRFPVAPINWNFGSIDDFHTAMQNLESGMDYSQYAMLPQAIKDMFIFFPGERHPITSPLPVENIYEKYREARKMPFGYGQEFLEFIQDTGKKEWIREKTFNCWSLQWIGDQIPETVEHSQRHSKRLMEFTTHLIHAIGKERFMSGVPRGMEDEFFFLLAVTMNIHDLGHTNNQWEFNREGESGAVLNLDGLPGMVRDLHHMLTVQMIDKNKVFPLLEEMDSVLGEKKSGNMLKAIKLVCEYHRGFMPVDGTTQPKPKNFTELFDLQLLPLEYRVLEEFPNQDEWQNLTLTAARWLRFIDATDVQADRTVAPEFTKTRARRTYFEARNLLEELLSHEEDSLKEWQVFKDLLQVEKLLDDKFLHDEFPFATAGKLEKKGEKLEKKVYAQLEKAISSHYDGGRICIPQSLRSLERLAFKIRQFVHFEKHSVVQMVYPRFFREKAFEEQDRGTLFIQFNMGNQNKESNLLPKQLKNQIEEDLQEEFERAGIEKLGCGLKRIAVSFEPESKED